MGGIISSVIVGMEDTNEEMMKKVNFFFKEKNLGSKLIRYGM